MDSLVRPLSKAEHEVFLLTIDGKTERAIARQRGVSHHTVRAQMASVKWKLGVQTKLEAVVKGINLGLHHRSIG